MPIESIIERKSLGVLMHPTCIPGGSVCGTFGRGAKEWIKKLHSMELNTGNFYLLHLLTQQVLHIAVSYTHLTLPTKA